MAVQELDGIVVTDKSLLLVEKSSKQSDVCQASTSSNATMTLYNTAIEPFDYFWPASTLAPEPIPMTGGQAAGLAYQGRHRHLHIPTAYCPDLQSIANSLMHPNTFYLRSDPSYPYGQVQTSAVEAPDPIYSCPPHIHVESHSKAPMQSTYIHKDITPPPMACRRSLSSIDEHAFGYGGCDSFYGTPLEYSFAPHETDLPDLNQGEWETLHSPPERSGTLRSSPETPFQDTPGSMQENNLPTPGNDVESNLSFHTAAGEFVMGGTPPFASNNLADCHEIGDVHGDDGHAKFQTCPEHERHTANRGRDYPCRNAGCNRKFQSDNQLQRHARTHHKSYHCKEPRCDWKFAFEKDLIRHRETRHGFKRPYLCPDPWCKFARDGFKRKDNLKRHMQNAHPGYYEDPS